ncbi:MAG: TonB-dependent receptor [Acidobacteria bacterium]|nr:TonB-dependent receptor [Acidobacteriota bacterium]
MTRFCKFASCALLVLCGTPAWAQGTAQISGIVRDESGGVLPGVTVTATQTETGLARDVVTGEAGTYAIPNLPTGPYRVEAMLLGFRPYARTGIVLQVGASLVLDVQLALGGLEESVTVAGETPLVDVRRAGVSEVVDQQRIVELPLQGRQVTDLIVLAGAAVNTGLVASARGRSDAGAISVAGGMRTGVAYTLDGALHNDPFDNLNLAFPFPDALQEFQVATGGLSAESGMHSGASVNAVTKSGTNRFSGNAFEVLRHHRFNATNPFAAVGADGQRLSDGLVRNQFGGTFGGPILTDKLFFFGAYQATRGNQESTANIAWVPTAAMLAGDFTARASAACNGGRAIALRAPFVNNRVDPSLISPISLAIAKTLPQTTDPCGQVAFSAPIETNNPQGVVKLDYQLAQNHSLFGRYLVTDENISSAYAATKNPLTVRAINIRKQYREQSTAVGHTAVLSSAAVNALRFTRLAGYNRLNNPPVQYFDPPSLGIKSYAYVPGTMVMAVTDGFNIGSGVTVGVTVDKSSYQFDDQFSLVKGRHQFGFGANAAHWNVKYVDYGNTNATFTFRGRVTGLGLADFMVGKMDRFVAGAPSQLHISQTYLGIYAQDSWRVSNRVTLNVGMRWEPYFGQEFENGAVVNFSLENFRQGVRSQTYLNAPPGLLFPGDPGVSKRGINTQWKNFSPRAGVAWDVHGDGRTALRSSYAMNYDLPTGQFMSLASRSAPFGNRVTLNGTFDFDDPWRGFPGGNPFPTPYPPTAASVFPTRGQYLAMDPDLNSTRVQSWNVTVEQQLGTEWVASASYLGSYIDRIWGEVQLNPGVFMGLGACTIGGVRYATCTTPANLDVRRVLSLEDQVKGESLSFLNRVTDIGEQAYRGVRLSLARRAASGVSASGNYTLAHCEADTYFDGNFWTIEEGYLDPQNPSFDRGNCEQNRRQVANGSLSYLTPGVGNAALRALVSNWRIAGIVNARSGNWLNITTSDDTNGTGIAEQRVNQVNDDVYGARTLENFLNRSAFALPAAGTLGNYRKNSIEGPGYWSVDMAFSRLINSGDRPALELRVEVFNLLNNFNWGDPVTVLNQATFGRITTMAGAPRIMQFGIKYAF